MVFLFHGCEFPPQAGGVGSYLFHMGAALQAAGHRAVIVTSRVPGLPAEEELACGRVYRVYDRSEMRSARVRDLVLALAREHRVDVMEGSDHLGEMANVLKAARRPPVLVKIHGSNPIRVVNDAHVFYPWQKPLIRLAILRHAGQTRAERFSIERADLVTAPSQRILDEVRAQGLRLPPHVEMIPNPISPAAAPAEKESKEPTMLFVGRLDIRKGIQYLPAILRRLGKRAPSVVLEMAGGDSYARGVGSMREWLTRQLGEQAKRVRFLGNLTGAELDRAYGRAWVVILPSRWDNFPTVLLEAAVRGKPIVSSPNGGMPEMLAGTLCPMAAPESPEFADRIADLMNEERLRVSAGQSARDKILSAYSPKSVVDRYLQFVHASRSESSGGTGGAVR